MSEIIIKVEAPEVVKAINNLANALSGNLVKDNSTSVNSVPPVQTTTTAPPPVVQAPTVPVAQTMPPVVQAPSPVPTTVQAPTSVPSYSIEQFQTAIAPLLDAGKVSQVQQLVQSFGVATLMEIPKERYGEFANSLRSIGGVL